MVDEGNKFLRLIRSRRSAPVHLMLVLQTDIGEEKAAIDAIRSVRDAGRDISLAYTISRYDWDRKLNAIWNRQWFWNIVCQSRMPLFMAFECILRRAKLTYSPHWRARLRPRFWSQSA
jgi:hypothetical protein